MPKILIIDDEPSIRKAMVLSLKAEGNEVMEADSGTSAQEVLKENQFDFIVLDLFVPTEADGMDILKICKELLSDAKVIMMTAHGSIERAVEAVKAGADVVLYVIDGGEHTWPGSNGMAALTDLLGPVSNAVVANDVIWEFFTAHTEA